MDIVEGTVRSILDPVLTGPVIMEGYVGTLGKDLNVSALMQTVLYWLTTASVM